MHIRILLPTATGRNCYIEGYRVGGKTGTAQISKDGAYVENAYI